jgi:hypothetical protein
MPISTDIKIGWDSVAVKKGFADLRTMFAGSIRGLRQVGIGGARQIGAQVTDLLGRTLMAVPEGISEMMDWVGNLNDMSAQTGLTVKKLAILQEALRLSGAGDDASRILSALNRNLYEAGEGMGPAREALHKLGLTGKQFKTMKLDESFKAVGSAIASFKGESGELESIMSDLFGARMGYKLIRFFKDYSGNMRQATSNTAGFGDYLNKNAGKIDEAGDALGRFKNRWRELMATVFEQGLDMFGGSKGINALFDELDPAKIREMLAQFHNFVGRNFTFMSGPDFQGVFKELGRMIGEGLKESISDMLPDLSPGGLLKSAKGAFGVGGESAAIRQLDEINAAIATGNRYLQKIETHRYGWA